MNLNFIKETQSSKAPDNDGICDEILELLSPAIISQFAWILEFYLVLYN